MTPIWSGVTPDLKNLVTIFSTFEASVLFQIQGRVCISQIFSRAKRIINTHLFKNDVPLDEISS